MARLDFCSSKPFLSRAPPAKTIRGRVCGPYRSTEAKNLSRQESLASRRLVLILRQDKDPEGQYTTIPYGNVPDNAMKVLEERFAPTFTPPFTSVPVRFFRVRGDKSILYTPHFSTDTAVAATVYNESLLAEPATKGWKGLAIYSLKMNINRFGDGFGKVNLWGVAPDSKPDVAIQIYTEGLGRFALPDVWESLNREQTMLSHFTGPILPPGYRGSDYDVR